MSESISISLASKEQYEEGLKRRLLQSALSQGVLYTLMFELKGLEPWAGATTTVEFETIDQTGPEGVPSSAFAHLSLFRDADYRVVAKIPGLMRDDFVMLDQPLELQSPHSGTLKRGIILPHDDEVDTTDLMESVSRELISSAPSGQ